MSSWQKLPLKACGVWLSGATPPADILEMSDDFIHLYESYREQLSLQKHGLMQQLLTGAVRVQVEE
ncbi:MAG: hypothetical protein F9K46_03590 [Anaerolineae bacterium]|nr:MAG: hypothetical protein F9K46_03590 [Anaerolineae bacterium]